MFECVYIQMQTSIITVSLDKFTLTKSLHGYSGAFLDFHIVCHSAPPPTVGQKGEVSQKFAKAYEFAFGSEVAETDERMQGTFWINMFLKSICEQNLIS